MFKTLFDSVALVALVVLVFLQNWRSALIPLVAVPVGIVGTFAVMLAMGFSLNNLTLFGLVLAIGIVVDDAIVVVECVEHHIEHGMAPREATIQAMTEVSSPVIAVGMVLSAVFIPCAFISGITGQFFRQFALTIASSTILSTFNSLTLSPALAALLLRPRRHGTYEALPRVAFVLLGCLAGYSWLPGHFLESTHSATVHADASMSAYFVNVAHVLHIPPERAAEGAAVVLGGLAGWAVSRPFNWILGVFFGLFNRGFQATAGGYARVVGMMLRVNVLVLLFYGGMLGVTYYGYAGFPKDWRESIHERAQLASTAGKQDSWTQKVDRFLDTNEIAKGIVQFTGVPRGFIPSQDMGYMLVNIQLPDSASLERTKAVISKINKISHDMPGINATVGIAGQSLLLNAYGSNFGTMFITLKEFAERRDSLVDRIFRWLELSPRTEMNVRQKLHLPAAKPSLYYEAIMNKLRGEFAMQIPEAVIAAFGPPPVRGVGRAGGFMIMIEDRGDLGSKTLQEQTENLVARANQQPELTGNTSVFRANVPQIYLDVDRTACMLKGVQLQDVFDTLQVYLGSLYVNDFNLFGRTWQVIAQAEANYRDQKDDIRRLHIRNSTGTMVPLGAVANVNEVNGPLVLTRYNMYPAASINGNAKPGVSSGRAIEVIESLADDPKDGLPRSMAYEWTELAYLELQAGNTAMIVFGFSIVMVFLMLAAQFESWSMPLAVILSVPLCILSALFGVYIAKMDINIFTQIGLVVLVGLASKNAILIVEFAKVIRRSGQPIREATLEACRLRLRPIIMTSLAFILGVIPLLLAHGAGAEMRQSLGMAVFSGMVGVTIFGVLLTPVFFYLIDTLSESHWFASPWVRRIGSVTLGIVTLSYLWRPSRWRAGSPAGGPQSTSKGDSGMSDL